MQSYRQSYGSRDRYRSKNRGFIIPLYDLGTIASGFYIGYNEGKGNHISPTVECLTKYGPTVFVSIMTPITLKLINSLMRRTRKRMIDGLESGELDVKIYGYTGGYIRKYKDLDESRQADISSKILKSCCNLESKINNQRYMKPTAIACTRTAIETAIGYAIGRVYSQIN